SALAPWDGPSISEHRVIYPNIFYISDQLYFGASGNLLYFAIWGFTILSAILLIAPIVPILKKRAPSSRDILIVLLFASCVIYWSFSEFNWENLTFQIQVCETACIAFMLLAFMAASRVSVHPAYNTKQSHDAAWASVAAVSAHIATFSWGAGLVCW